MAGIRIEDIAKSILSGETDDKILSQLAQSRRQQKVFKLEIRFTPHEMQRAFLESPSRFRIVCAGRRGGKTMGCVADEVRFAWEHPKSRCFWVAPVYQQTMRAFRMMVDFLPPKVITRIERTDRRLWLVNEAMIEFRSATDYENLRGEGIDFLVIDEAAYVAREAWEASLRPALADRMGRAVIISCVIGDTRLVTDRGMVRIDSLSDTRGVNGVSNISIATAGMFGSVQQATKFKSNASTRTIRIKTNLGIELEGTPDHPIYALDPSDGVPKWGSLEVLAKGNFVAVNKGMDLWGNDDDLSGFVYDRRLWSRRKGPDPCVEVMTSDLAYVMGLALGDGYVNYKLGKVCISHSPEESWMASFLESKPCGLDFSESKDKYQHVASSLRFTDFLLWYGFKSGKVAKQKEIPERLFRASKSTVANFLSGLFDADGSSHRNRGTVSLTSTSKSIVVGVQQLLLNFGIVSRVSEADVRPSGVTKVWSHIYSLSMNAKNSSLFYSLIGFRIPRKQENRIVADAVAPHAGAWIETSDTEGLAVLSELANNEYYWDEIVEITEGKAETFDLTVPESHAYVGNGLVCHNTPRGRGWFYELWQRGAARNDLFMASFRFPTSANPYIPREEIEQARETLPADVFQQEFEACFLEESAGVFRGIDKCIKGEIEYPSPDGNYVIGLDLARTTDYTVAVVMETGRKHVVYMDRFTKCDWQTQIERVAALSRRYNNALILMDSTGVGDPILSEIDARGLEVEGYTFTNQSKRALIEGLVLAIEKGGITYPHLEALISELRVYEYEISTTSNAVHYSAPSGFNDDCVIALALATYQSDNTWVRERVK